MNILQKFGLLALVAITVLSACKKNEIEEMKEPTGSFKASDQVISQNMISVDEVTMSDKGWVVVHAKSGNGPQVPEIISEPVEVNAGTSMDVKVPIKSSATINDGDEVFVMLHTDDGAMGTYEFDGSNGLDAPITDGGDIVTGSILIESAAITVMDQPVNNNTITIDKIVAAKDGWLVVHNDDGAGGIVLPGIIGKTMVQAGVNTNVTVQLDNSKTYSSGQKLFPMLHLDTGQEGVYEFDGNNGEDQPEIFGNEAFPNNVIFTSLTVQ